MSRPRARSLILSARYAQVASVVALAAAVTVITGWVTGQRDLQRLFATQVTIKANTAIGIALLSLSLFGAVKAGRSGGRWRILSAIGGFVAALIGLATLSQYVTGVDLGIDQLFISAASEAGITRTPGRMSAVTAILLVILGAAFVIDGWKDSFARVSQLLSLVAVAISLTMLLAYAYQAIPLAGPGHGFQSAVPTVILTLLFGFAGLFLNPHQGVMRVVLASDMGGVTARRLLPFAFLVPLAMSAVRFFGVRWLALDVETLNAATAVFTMLVFTGIIGRTAAKLAEADRLREEAERERLRLTGEAEAERARAEAELGQRLLVEAANSRAQAALREKEQVQRQLLHAQKMEAVGQLAGGVAHDFNNLLTVIHGNSSFIKEDLAPDDERRQYAQEIEEAAERAAGLTRQLLTFSRKHVAQARPLQVDDVVRGMERMIHRLLPSNIELVVRPGAEAAVVEIDPGQLEQALMNLAINARDAMPDGGRLAIETRVARIHKESGQLELPARPGDYVLIEMSDTGIGIPAVVRERMFEPFFTTKAAGSGTGLGLSIVYGVVQEHGGTIGVYSEPGQGSTFKVYLPLSEKTLMATQETSLEVPRGSEIILVVDDDDAVREVVRASLERYGYTVLDARDGAHALEVSEIFRGLPDLLLTDLMMPRVTGRELVDALAQRGARPRVLLMSGYTDDEVLRRGLRDKRYPFIQKPFTREEIARKVREVLDADQ